MISVVRMLRTDVFVHRSAFPGLPLGVAPDRHVLYRRVVVAVPWVVEVGERAGKSKLRPALARSAIVVGSVAPTDVEERAPPHRRRA